MSDTHRDSKLSRVRKTTAARIDQLAKANGHDWIDQLDVLVDAGLAACGYPGLDDVPHTPEPRETTAAALKAVRTARSDKVREQAVTLARAAGATWQDVATALGVSKQAAHKRYAS